MNRKLLLAAVALGPFMAQTAQAQVTISNSTSTPVLTATANSGQPANVTINSGVTIGPTVSTSAVTINSSNTVNNAGALSFSNINNAVGATILGGYTGNFTNTGSISVSETYTAKDTNNDGLANGAFAQGTNRTGILVSGPGTFTGYILDTGAMTIQGNNSQGISIQSPITGYLDMKLAAPATSSSAATNQLGTIQVTGANAIGLQVTPSGGIGGYAYVNSITANGPGASALQINGPVGGFLNIDGTIAATGYRTNQRSTNPAIAINYSADEMQQSGAAVTLGGSVAGGVILSAPPPILSTTNLDLDGDGVPDSVQSTGRINAFGTAPALQIGAVASAGGAAPAIVLGPYLTGTGAGTGSTNFLGYGLVVQGSISADSLFDPLTYPYLPHPVSATALQIGGNILISPETYSFAADGRTLTGVTPAVYAPSGSVTVKGGVFNSGSILAQAYQANATAIHIGAGATVPVVANDGQISALSTQLNSSTGPTNNGSNHPVTPAPVAVAVTGVQIDSGASVAAITNNSGILAQISGTGGVGGSATAIVDKSGSLQSLNNTGSIVAQLNQTLFTKLMPGTTTAIDLSAGSLPQTITQTVSPNVAASTPYSVTNTYTVGQIVSYQNNIYQNVQAAGKGLDPVNYGTYWRQIGALSPSITGNIYLGSGWDTINVQGGTVTASTIAMGGGLNTVTVNNGATVTGALTETSGGQFALNVANGKLTDLNANAVRASSVNVGSSGVLIVSADPVHGTHTDFITSGSASLAAGAQIGLNLNSVQTAKVADYTVIQGVAGAPISAPSIISAQAGNTPYGYTAAASYSPATDSIDLLVTRKTPAQMGLNAAEASAYDAVLAAAPADANIQSALLAQTTQSGFKATYDQLLPNQGQGIFQALDAAAQKVAGFVQTPPDAGTRVGPATSLWLQQVNERVERSGLDTLASKTNLIGVVGGVEHLGRAGGAVGVTLAYFNASENDSAAAVNEKNYGSILEAGVYYRRSMGALTLAARGAGGYAWFSEDRLFVSSPAYNQAHANWSSLFANAHFGAAYEVKYGRFYGRPELSLDYTRLHSNGYTETGGGPGFDLRVTSQNDTQFTGQALMVLGAQWGRANWFRSEVRFGYREVFSGSVGGLTANFIDGAPFALAGDPDRGGWATVGFSLKNGTPYSYIALEGDADFRNGEDRYDLRVAGRAMF
jgi:hypothetical protein